MGLMSTLALLALPLLKRPQAENASLASISTTLVDECNALKAELTELKAQINDLKGRLDAEQSAHMWTRRDRDYWYEDAGRWQAHARAWQPLNYGPLFGFQQSQALAQQAQQAQQALAQSPFQQLQAWHDCTCVPGRAAAFGIHREDDQ